MENNTIFREPDNANHHLSPIFNPLWKVLAHLLAARCSECGRERLFSVFNHYLKDGDVFCKRCSLLSKSMVPFLGFVFSRLAVKDNTVKQLLKDPLIRRCMLSVVKGIANFGIRYPQPAGAPVTVVWNFTNRCNLNCLHCHQGSSPLCSDSELTTSEAFKVIDNLSEAGVAILTFSGGEPLLRPDLYDTAKRACDRGMLCTVASNGTLITSEVAKRLSSVGINRVEIGLDGSTAATHDFLRDKPGAFEETIEGIRNCAAADFDELAVTMTLHSGNINELQATMELAEKLGATRFYLNRLIPAGRGAASMNLDVSKIEKVEALKLLYQKFFESVTGRGGMQCYARGMTYYARLGYDLSNGEVFTVSEALSGYENMFQEKHGLELSRIINSRAAGFSGCSVGLTYAGLTASGDLLPCVPAPIVLGNLLKQPLEEIWLHNRLLNYVRDRRSLKGLCSKCIYRGVCGGCRYTAYVTDGDWLGTDFSCPFGSRTNKDN